MSKLIYVADDEKNICFLIENFLEKEIYKIPVPEELGEAPEYKPRSNDGRKRSSFKGGGRRNNGTGKGGNRNNNKLRDGSKKPTQAKKQE